MNTLKDSKLLEARCALVCYREKTRQRFYNDIKILQISSLVLLVATDDETSAFLCNSGIWYIHQSYPAIEKHFIEV